MKGVVVARKKSGRRGEKHSRESRQGRTTARRKGIEAKRSGQWDFDPAALSESWQNAGTPSEDHSTKGSPYHPTRDEEFEGEDHLYWWQHPNHGRVLVFDPHGMRVHEAEPVLRRLRDLTSGNYVFVVHGYNRGTAIRDRMYAIFGPRACETYAQNKGLTRVRL